MTVHRSPYSVGDTFTAEEARSLGGSRATFPSTLDTFTVQEVVKMSNKSGSYYIYATSPSTEISFSVMFPRFGRKTNGNKPYFTSFRWYNPEATKPASVDKVPTLDEMDISLVNKIVPAGQRGKMFLRDYLGAIE